MNKCSASSKRNSVSPPNWEQSSEEDQPLDFSRTTVDESKQSERINQKSSNIVSSTQSQDESCAVARLFLSPTSPQRNSSPQTISPDNSDAEPSDGATKLSPAILFARASLPSNLSPSELIQNHDILNPTFNPLYQYVYPSGIPQMDLALLRGNGGYGAAMEQEYLRYKQQQVLHSQKMQRDMGRRKHGIPSSSPTPSTIKSPELMSELSEHSNDSQHISTSSLTSAPVTPTKSQSTGRRRGKAYPEEMKDDAYWERRRKNNEAAKRSRDARRAKEDETAIRAAFLEEENRKLRAHNTVLETELRNIRLLLYAPSD